MKKPALLIIGLLLLAYISIYFIIPRYIVVKSSVPIDVTDVNAAKFLINKKQWWRWWPGEYNQPDSTTFTLNGVTYKLKNDANSFIELSIGTGKISADSKLSYLAIDEGATTVSWEATMQSGINPFTRIGEYFKMKAEERQMDTILNHFKTFMQNDKNVYGLHIKLGKVKDGILIATNKNTTAEPGTELIYTMIADLRKQINAQGAVETNLPMLNIHQTDANDYQVMVAIPINKLIKPGNGSLINKMVIGANILETEVHGGRNSINNGFIQLKNYQKDHGLISPAMPFEQIITDRTLVKDTNKWVTKVYWPIF